MSPTTTCEYQLIPSENGDSDETNGCYIEGKDDWREVTFIVQFPSAPPPPYTLCKHRCLCQDFSFLSPNIAVAS